MAGAKEMQAYRHMRQSAAKKRRGERWAKITWYAALAEAFFLALSPTIATIALLVGIVAMLLRKKFDRSFHWRHLPFDWPILFFTVLSALSILNSPDRAFSFYNWYNLVGVYVLTYLLMGQTIASTQQIKKLFFALAVSALFVALYGYYQFFFGIDVTDVKWVDANAFPELRKRVFSTWENPNILAGYLDVVICLAFGFFVKAKGKIKRTLLLVFMLLMAACLGMTYARGACFVLAVIFLAYGLLKDWRVLIAFIVLAAIALVINPVLLERLTSVFTTMDTSTEMRLAFWESTIAMIQDHPFLGIGWGAYWMVYPEYDFYMQGAAGVSIVIVHAHNLYLNYMAEIGIPGALTFFWFFFGTMYLALKQKFVSRKPRAKVQVEGRAALDEKFMRDVLIAEREEAGNPAHSPKQIWHNFAHWTPDRLLAGASLGIGLALISIALNGITDDLLFNIPTSMYLWMLAAVAAVIAKQNCEQTAEEESN